MKKSLVLLCGVGILLASTVQSWAIPTYFLQKADFGIVGDIPGITITTLGPNRWDIDLFPGLAWDFGGSSASLFLADPGNPGHGSRVTFDMFIPRRITWEAGLTVGAHDVPISTPVPVSIVLGQIGQVGWVNLRDITSGPVLAPVPDAASTAQLLGAALASIGAFGCCRRKTWCPRAG